MKPVEQSLALAWATLDAEIGALEDLTAVSPSRLRKLLRRAFYAGAAASLELTTVYAAGNRGIAGPAIIKIVAEIAEEMER